MKKSLSIYLIIAAASLLLFATCKKDKNDDPVINEIKVTSITLDKDTLTLFVDESATLVATVLPINAANKTVTWTSSDPTVVTVRFDGVIKALKQGTATITVTTKDGGMTATCSVTARYSWEPVMVFVEPGTFTMGCPDDEDFDGALPAHQVTLTSGYYIGKYEITQAQWKAVMGSNPSHFRGDNLPVEYVHWDDVQKFLAKLNELTGKKYRLPTEAEWEFACRGGKHSAHYKYSGSNNIYDVAWCGAYSGGNSGETTHPVGTRQPNELGIYDMSGNVWEWCQDWYGAYTEEPQTDPQGPATGINRVARGGGWYTVAEYCHVSNRFIGDPDFRDNSLGFRVALSP